MKTEKKNDLRMIGILLLVSITAFAMISFFKHPGDKIIITVDGEVYAELNLKEDTELDIEDGKNGFNQLVIADGFASITRANCPDLICVHQKKISQSGETLVCLPHKVVVEVKSARNKQGANQLDGVAD